jgi:hypothetical protein
MFFVFDGRTPAGFSGLDDFHKIIGSVSWIMVGFHGYWRFQGFGLVFMLLDWLLRIWELFSD